MTRRARTIRDAEGRHSVFDYDMPAANASGSSWVFFSKVAHVKVSRACAHGRRLVTESQLCVGTVSPGSIAAEPFTSIGSIKEGIPTHCRTNSCHSPACSVAVVVSDIIEAAYSFSAGICSAKRRKGPMAARNSSWARWPSSMRTNEPSSRMMVDGIQNGSRELAVRSKSPTTLIGCCSSYANLTAFRMREHPHPVTSCPARSDQYSRNVRLKRPSSASASGAVSGMMRVTP